MLYFAYGANLNRRNLKRMAPRAAPLCTAKLSGFRLVFRGHCDITPDPKSFVMGGLYELSDACVRALDHFEGPDYSRITVTVETDEGPREAMAYKCIERDIAPPDLAYYNVVARGYTEWKLDATPLKRARYATIRR